MAHQKRFNLHRGLGYRLNLLASINARKFEAKISTLGLTRLMWCVLVAVEEEGLNQPSEIAEFIGINRTAASRTLRQMRDRNLIARVPGRDDGRNVIVTSTEEGRRALNAAIPMAQATAMEIRSKLTDDEHAIFEELVDKMLDGEYRNLSRF